MAFNRFCELFGLDVPIVQAPTGSIAGPDLCAAVSAAGGLGSMGLTWTPPGVAADCVRHVRRLTDRPFVANFALSFRPDALEGVLEAGVPIIAFSWGDPWPHLGIVRAAGAKVGLQVGNRDGARLARDLGVDFIICQCVSAGGHVQSTQEMSSLLPNVVEEAGEVPIVAAGGIADGAGIARVMQMGAQAAMLGTRFVATVESRAHPEYKRRILAAEGPGDTALTICFDGGWPHAPHRVLRNPTLERWEAEGCVRPGIRRGEGETVAFSAFGEPILRYEDTAPREGMHGRVEEMALYAGTGVGAIHDLPHGGDLVRRLWSEAGTLMHG